MYPSQYTSIDVPYPLNSFALAVPASPFKSTLRLEAENAVLRHQLIVLKRKLHGRVRPRRLAPPAAKAGPMKRTRVSGRTIVRS
jgi:hypothetical protein